jgi:hypothetical protein
MFDDQVNLECRGGPLDGAYCPAVAADDDGVMRVLMSPGCGVISCHVYRLCREGDGGVIFGYFGVELSESVDA